MSRYKPGGILLIKIYAPHLLEGLMSGKISLEEAEKVARTNKRVRDKAYVGKMVADRVSINDPAPYGKMEREIIKLTNAYKRYFERGLDDPAKIDCLASKATFERLLKTHNELLKIMNQKLKKE